uniref:PX domain-containing protein n=1 Tax=Arcella intermedia TaxID=1963864 RepID=A0A6B2LNM7_9EUKA
MNTKRDNNATVSVQRRYNEFYSLYQNLKIEFPYLILPPFPEKSLNPLVNNEFLEHRRKGLEKFMRKVLHHPELPFSLSVQAFMTIPVLDKDFVQKTGSVTGFISSSISTAVGGGPTSYKEIDPKYDEYKAYYTNLERSSQGLVFCCRYTQMQMDYLF